MRDPRQMSFEELFNVGELARAIIEKRDEDSSSHLLALVTLKALHHIDALEEQVAELRGVQTSPLRAHLA